MRSKNLLIYKLNKSLAVKDRLDCGYLLGVFTFEHSFQFGFRLFVEVPELQKVNYTHMVYLFAVARHYLVPRSSLFLEICAGSLLLELVDVGLTHVKL